MPNDLDSAKKIIELYERKIESQITVSVGFFGASIFLFLTYFTRVGDPLNLSFEWLLWLSYITFSIVIIAGFLARMSLIACVPPMMNYKWEQSDASSANYAGKSTLEKIMFVQVVAFLLGLVLTGLFFVVNMRDFVS